MNIAKNKIDKIDKIDPKKSSSSFLIAPSILSADFAKLGEEIKLVEIAGADWIHIDVMDGHFVPNLTIGAPVVKNLRPITKMPLDVHLMIDEPEKYILDFAKAGADYITVHVEACDNIKICIDKIRSAGCKPGLTLRPHTGIETLVPYLKDIDLVLVMTVEPGFGGQTFMEGQISKIERLSRERVENDYEFLIEVDGGINAETAKLCRQADVLVAGSYIFGKSYKEAINNLKEAKWK